MGSVRRSKRFCLLFAGTVLVLFGVLLSYVFVFDPWQLFHRPWFRDTVFITNARFQNAGLINSYDFDSAIVGNSMAENFSAAEASEILGGKFINLSMAGSLFIERQIILEHLFRKKKIKSVLLSIDHLPYVRLGQFNDGLPPEQYDFLYNANPVDDLKIYFDYQLLRCWDLNKTCKKKIPGARKKSLDSLYAWFPYYVKAFGGPDAWCYWSRRSAGFKSFLQEAVNVSREITKGHENSWSDTFINECRENTRSTFDAYLLPVIQEHPATRFYLFFPPYSRLWLSMQALYYTGYFQSYLNFVEDVVSATASCDNVLVFGFDDFSFPGELANYKDQSHYHKDINTKILTLIAEKKGIIRPDSTRDYIDRVRRLASGYDLKALTDQFEACLKGR